MQNSKTKLNPSPGIGHPSYQRELDDNEVIQSMAIAMENVQSRFHMDRVCYDDERLNTILRVKNGLIKILPHFEGAYNYYNLKAPTSDEGAFKQNMPRASDLLKIGDFELCRKLYGLAYSVYVSFQADILHGNPVYMSFKPDWGSLGREVESVIKYLDLLYNMDTSILEFGRNLYIMRSYPKSTFVPGMGMGPTEHWYYSVFYLYKFPNRENPEAERVSPLLNDHWEALKWVEKNEGKELMRYTSPNKDNCFVSFPTDIVFKLPPSWYTLNSLE